MGTVSLELSSPLDTNRVITFGSGYVHLLRSGLLLTFLLSCFRFSLLLCFNDIVEVIFRLDHEIEIELVVRTGLLLGQDCTSCGLLLC